MPTYEYICEKCGHQFELVQPITAKTLTVCPKTLCTQKRWGKGKVKRVITGGAGLIFKGSGFYETDYRSEGYKAAAKRDSDLASSSSASSSKPAKGETKPAAGKSDSKPAKPVPSKT
jgi:putative FmdB family regulatory protein